jgi:hypothetical protein
VLSVDSVARGGVYGRGIAKSRNSVPTPCQNKHIFSRRRRMAVDKEGFADGIHVERDRQQIHKWVVPYLGSKPIASIEAPDLLEVLKRIESKGVIDTAHRTREVCGRIFRYAIATGRARHDIAADLVGALAPRTTTHHAAITDPAKWERC